MSEMKEKPIKTEQAKAKKESKTSKAIQPVVDKSTKELLEDSIKVVQNEITKLTRLSGHKTLLGKDSAKTLTDYIRILLAADASDRKHNSADDDELNNISPEELLEASKIAQQIIKKGLEK